MAELYSRYAPPKKKQKTDPAPPPIFATKQTPSPAKQVTHTKLDASSTYKRHVPSSSSKRVSSSQEHKPAGDKPQPSDKNLDNTILGDVDRDCEGGNYDSIRDRLELVENKSMDVDTTIKREKRKKKEKKPASEPKHVARETDADGESSEEDARHASILARRNKSLKKAEKITKKAAKKTIEENTNDVEKDIEMMEPTEFHALEPMPQPKPVPESTREPEFSALPSWMTNSIKVSPTETASFSDLGIQEGVISALRVSGFNEAFAVQAAVLPLLLPSPQRQPGDVLVSAATGSGKTLAYVLPMIEDISNTSTTLLRGLIVVPTKELVSQVKEVCDICASAFVDHKKYIKKHVQVGIAMGDQSLKKEQAALMNQEQQDDMDNYRNPKSRWNVECSQDFEDPFSTLSDLVLNPESKADILICTPGRLVEHLKSTPGFTLQHLRWLVIDEADKLLDQSFQEWIETIMAHLPNDNLRKVVLSATMTSDVGQLSSLKLHRQKLVVLEGENNDLGKDFALPATLHETAIKVHDDNDKPLYLLELLHSRKMVEMDNSGADDSSSTTFSSDDDSELAEDNTSSSGEESYERSISISAHPKGKSSAVRSQTVTKSRGVIIFTRSNEDAVRLSRLLTLMDPNLEGAVGTVTSEIGKKIRQKTLAAFQLGTLSVVVASDLASRGLDIPSLAHVVNYDIPSSLPSYVHRVGRTARAGKKGNAWTLFTPSEAAWFLNEIARSVLVNRNSRKVEMSKIDPNMFSDELRAQYERAVELLGEQTKGQR